EDQALGKGRHAAEAVEYPRLEEGGPSEHDGPDQRPEQASAGPQQIFGRARCQSGSLLRCHPFAQRLVSDFFHSRPIRWFHSVNSSFWPPGAMEAVCLLRPWNRSNLS